MDFYLLFFPPFPDFEEGAAFPDFEGAAFPDFEGAAAEEEAGSCFLFLPGCLGTNAATCIISCFPTKRRRTS